VSEWLTAQWGGASAATWDLRLAAIRSAVTWWREKGRDVADLAAGLKNRGEHPVMAPDVVTEDELRAMLAQCSLRAPTGIRNRALIAVMYRAGLRRGEALALRCSDISEERGTLTVRAGKGGKQRVVAIDDGALAVVQRWLDKRRELGLHANGGPLFCTLDGGELSGRYVGQMVTRIAARAGVEKRAHPHGMRRSHTAELVSEKVPMPVIQKQLGHASLAVTDHYTRHIAPAEVIAMGRARKSFSDTGKEPEGEPDLAAELRQLRERLAALEEGSGKDQPE
jgi:site-specific recombinase XerD